MTDLAQLSIDELNDLVYSVEAEKKKRIKEATENNKEKWLQNPKVQKILKRFEKAIATLESNAKSLNGEITIPLVLKLKLKLDLEDLEKYKTNIINGLANQHIWCINHPYATSTSVDVDLSDTNLTKKQKNTLEFGVEDYVAGACNEIFDMFPDMQKIEKNFDTIKTIFKELLDARNNS